jgi:hypothetical protein
VTRWVQRTSDARAQRTATQGVAQLWKAFETRDPASLSKVMAHDEDVIIFSTDATERWVGYEAFMAAEEEVMAAFDVERRARVAFREGASGSRGGEARRGGPHRATAGCAHSRRRGPARPRADPQQEGQVEEHHADDDGISHGAALLAARGAMGEVEGERQGQAGKGGGGEEEPGRRGRTSITASPRARRWGPGGSVADSIPRRT